MARDVFRYPPSSILARKTWPQTKSHIQSLLTSAGTSPRHRFGQNFMIDQNLVRLIAAAANVTAGEVLIEVGRGHGNAHRRTAGDASRSRRRRRNRSRSGGACCGEKYADEPRFEAHRRRRPGRQARTEHRPLGIDRQSPRRRRGREARREPSVSNRNHRW